MRISDTIVRPYLVRVHDNNKTAGRDSCHTLAWFRIVGIR